MIDSLCVVGGGTSGCVAALMLKKSYPQMKVTMIESSQIGIIGVGEGSTEHWKKFLEHIDIDVPTLFRETGATYKVGIKFTNWHGDGTHYFHSLSEQFSGIDRKNGQPITWMMMIGENWDPLKTTWSVSTGSRHVEPLHNIVAQYHFDTFKLNDFLHKECRARGIEIIDAEIENVILDESGDVKELVDKENRRHTADFFIDCSGFRKVINSKLGAKWLDKKEYLPMNSAIAFPTPYTEDIPSYTEATALSSGWCWRIPTQERYGNGYVFCDSFIDENKAYDEVSEHYKKLGISDNLQIGRKVKFGAGYVDKFWIKNCVSIGLSGIFVEPLEASSIGTTIQQCFILIPSLFYYTKGDTFTSVKYNENMSKVAENIIDFIQLHYFTERSDSEFWKWCKNNIKKTDFNANYLEYFSRQYPNVMYFDNFHNLFQHMNFAQVMHGLRMFKNEEILSKYEKYLSDWRQTSLQVIEQNNNSIATGELKTVSHREAVNLLKERYLNEEHNL
jgi:flavin-dependent dehydrogenase